MFASGSPQDPVEWNGNSHVPSQANNMYIFPGVALGAWLARSGVITDQMLMASSEALSQCTTEEELALGMVYPSMTRIRCVDGIDFGALSSGASVCCRNEGASHCLMIRQSTVEVSHLCSKTAQGNLAERGQGSYRCRGEAGTE